MDMITTSTIEITRATGPIGLCGMKMEFDSWDDVNDSINAMIPTVNYCDDVDFTIRFEDGTEYNGSMEIYNGTKKASLQDHIRRHLSFNAGVNRPSHFTEQQYQQYLAAVKPEMIEECGKFIAEYTIG